MRSAMISKRLFVLSPVSVAGARVRQLLRDDAHSDLARRLRSEGGATVAEVFSFVSALYFRGKLEYAAAFAAPPSGAEGVLVIVPGRGLLPSREVIDRTTLRAVARVPVDPREPSYRGSLQRDAERLGRALPADTEVVLLGSIATDKYLGPLVDPLGGRLRVPRELIGLGMMSRGSLLRRCAREGRELAYVSPESKP